MTKPLATLCALLTCSLLGCSSTVNVASEPAAAQPLSSPATDAATDAPADAAPVDPIALVIGRDGPCCEGRSSSATVYEDGRTRVRTCASPAACTETRARLPGAAADVAALRRAIEATGVIEIEDGAYPSAATSRGISLTYHYAGVVRAWSTDNTAEAPGALNRAVVAVNAAMGTTVPE